MDCNCPVITCKRHGVACVAHCREGKTLANCMEEVAQNLSAVLPLKVPKTIVCDDYEAMSKKSAELIVKVVNEKPDALISLPAGSTAARTFHILHEMQAAHQVDFSKAKFVALDEWLDLANESENCAAFMRKNFYTPLGILDENITFFDTHSTDLDEECKRVDEVIFAHGGIDCMLLGIGLNGHLGLNEPGESFDSYAKVINLDTVTMQVGQKYFSSGMQLTRGITLGIRHMFETKLVILQAGTKTKADIISKMYHSQPTIALPATVMQLLSDSVVVLDKDAASKISDIIG